MKITKITLLLAALASALPSAPAFADRGRSQYRGHHHARPHHFHRHHSHLGIFIGAPLVLAPWYVAPRYYYPPAVVVPPAPAVYIERPAPAQSAEGEQFWYYCRESETYYPYVKECAGPWQRVVPHAPPS